MYLQNRNRLMDIREQTFGCQGGGMVWEVGVRRYSSVQSLSCVLPMDCSMQGFPVHHQPQSLLKLMFIRLVVSSNHLILCRPLFLLPSIIPSIRVFSNESVLHIGGPKYWSFSFSISPSNEFSGLISFGIDWFDLLPVQGTLKSPLQHRSSKASILWCSAFLMVQPSHPFRPSF